MSLYKYLKTNFAYDIITVYKNGCEVNDEIAEINTMQLELQSKLDSDYIKQIIDRNTKYISIHNFNKYSLKDGVLENKIRITM